MVSLDYRLIGSCGFVGLWCRRILRFYWTVVMQDLVVSLDYLSQDLVVSLDYLSQDLVVSLDYLS